RRLHTFRLPRPARLRTPLLGYGAPHLSARGTSTLLNNALLSAHFRLADNVESIWVLDALRRRDAEKRGVLELRNDNRQHGNRSDPFRAAPDYPGVSSDSY